MKYILLKENIEKARKILAYRELDENDPSFIKIKEMLVDYTGFLGLFAFLFYRKKVTLPQLSELLETLIANRRLLKNLPKEVVNYEKLEELYDDISSAREWVIYNKEFVSRLTAPLKKEARKDKVLKNAYVHLPGSDKKDLLFNFVKKVARYKQDYSKFKNDCLYYINRNGQDILEVENDINKTKGAYLVYNKGNVLIAEIYTKEASCALGSKSWCISDGSSNWEEYMGLEKRNKQYFIWNFNIPSYDIESQVGSTIKSGGSVRTSHLKDDSSVSIYNYLSKYEIEKKLTPLDLRVDINKIMECYKLSPEIISMMYDSGRIDEFLHLIPRGYHYLYGLVPEEESNLLPDFKKYIYSKKDHEIIESLFLFCNKLKYTDEDEVDKFFQENKDSEFMNEINKLDFRDKIMLLNKYQYVDLDARSWTTDDYITDGNRLYESSLEVLFHKELKEQDDVEHPMVFDVDVTTGEITFKFEYDEYDYATDILNVDNDLRYSLDVLDSNILQDDNSDELNYIPYRFTDELKKTLLKYYNFMLGNISHTEIIKDLEELISDAENDYADNNDSFNDVVEFMSVNVDPNFGEPDKYKQHSYFTEFWDRIMTSASGKVDEDVLEYQKAKKGDWESHKGGGTWSVKLSDIVSNITGDVDNFNLDTPFSITDWFDNYPSDLSDMDSHFDDYPYSGTYINLADAGDACEGLVEELEDVMAGYHDKFELKEIESIKEYTDYFNKVFIPKKFDFNERNFSSDTLYCYVKETDDYLAVIPVTSIGSDGYVKVYNVPTSLISIMNDVTIERYSDMYFDLSYLLTESDEELTKREIIIKELWVDSSLQDMQSLDPNQLEFKFEKLKTFEGFMQTK
jgi:hypothetical protein